MATSTKKVTIESLVTLHSETDGAKRKGLRDGWMAESIRLFMAGNADDAKVYAAAVDAAKASSSSRTSAAVEIDWNTVTRHRAEALIEAGNQILSGLVLPNGTPSDVTAETLAAVSFDADDVHDAAVDLASVRVAGQRNVPEFIVAAISRLGDGWHTASELAKGDLDAPSTGAIGAVYAKVTDTTSDFTIEGVEVGHNEKGTQAFRAIA